MGRRTAAAAVTAAALVGALAGCGGAKGTSGLSTKQFSDQADAACQRLAATVTAIPRPTAGDLATLATYAQGLVTSYQAYLDQLTPLVAKAADRTTLQQKWITPQTQQFAASKPLLNQLVAAAKAGDKSGVTTISAKIAALPDTTSAVQVFQRQYGVGDCADLLDDFRG